MYQKLRNIGTFLSEAITMFLATYLWLVVYEMANGLINR